MISIIIFMACIMSGSIFSAAVLKRRFEDAVPLTCMGIILILYILGLMDGLEYGVYLVFGVAFSLYVFSAVYLCRHKEHRKGFAGNVFTPAFFVFIILAGIFVYADFGKYAETWDEFSHWMDCVKAMAYLDDFVTNAGSHSGIQSYPPGISLFEYFIQKVYFISQHTDTFSEWRVFFAWKILLLSFPMPLLKGLTVKKPLRIIVSMAMILFLPASMYTMYNCILSDQVIGILAGVGFVAVLFQDETDIFHTLHISCICFLLVLVKDAGLFFAVFVATAFLGNSILQYGQAIGFRARCINGVVPAVALIAAKASWKWELAATGVPLTKGGDIKIMPFLRMALFHDGTDYRQTVVDNYIEAFFTRKVERGGPETLFTNGR